MTILEDRTFTELVKTNFLEWALFQCDQCPYKKRKFAHRHECAQRKDDVNTQGEDCRARVKERGLRRNQPCGCLGLRHPASRIVRK